MQRTRCWLCVSQNPWAWGGGGRGRPAFFDRTQVVTQKGKNLYKYVTIKDTFLACTCTQLRQLS